MTRDLPAHSVIRTLDINDLDQVIELEHAVFSEHERCSREAAAYRLTACPELSAGVFIRRFRDPEDEIKQEEVGDESVEDRNEDYEDIDEDEEGLPSGTSLLASEELIAHILATKTNTEFVTNDSMEIPDMDEFGRIKVPKHDKRGHREEGGTIAVHSVSVKPAYQGQSVGTVMLRDYIQRVTTQHIANRISLLCHEELVPFYERQGFKNAGVSDCTYGGVQWRDMWMPLSESDDEYDE